MRSLRSAALAAIAAVALQAVAVAGQRYKAEVQRVDATASKVTLKHGAIPKLDMGAMTMGYRVADPAMLNGVKAGDHVTFDVEGTEGDYTVTKIEKAK